MSQPERTVLDEPGQARPLGHADRDGRADRADHWIRPASAPR
jgi:hypothetical protein